MITKRGNINFIEYDAKRGHHLIRVVGNNQEQRVEIMCDVYNICKEINPEHPELVAQNIKEMYAQLVSIKTAFEHHSLHDVALVKAVLSKIKGGE
jgi:hypothetical protein